MNDPAKCRHFAGISELVKGVDSHETTLAWQHTVMHECERDEHSPAYKHRCECGVTFR